MTRRELKIYGAFIVLGSLVVTGVRVGLELLGARDEMTAVFVVATFVLLMFLMTFLPTDSPPGKR